MWLPTSTCDSGCLPPAGAVPRVSPPTVLARLVAVLAVVLVALAVVPLLPRALVPAAVRRLARALLAALGVRHAARGPLTRRGALVVANHVSWLDVVVLTAYFPCRLLAKQEVGTWPVIGRLARAAGTIFIDRTRPRTLPATIGRVTAALRDGAVVAAFPEGTTWCGHAGGRFRPALFQAAVSAGAVVTPVRLTFRLADSTTTTVAAFVGDDTLVASFLRVLTARGLSIGVRAHGPLRTAPGASRRRLASTVHAVVAAGPS